MKLLLGAILIFLLSQAAGVAVELAMNDIVSEIERVPPVAPEVKALMRKHGVIYFDWNSDRQEFGYWRDGKWCKAK